MFGSFFVGRAWQGKTVLLIVLVPVLLAQLHDYGRAPSRGGLVRLALLSIAAIGLSTTAIFLVPTIAFACMAALALQDRACRARRLRRDRGLPDRAPPRSPSSPAAGCPTSMSTPTSSPATWST